VSGAVPPLEKGSGPRVVYVAGSMRSGSTLLTEMLGSLDGAIAIGELTDLWSALAEGAHCSCGAVATQCSVWRPALQDVWEEHRIAPRDHARVRAWIDASVRTRHIWSLLRLRGVDPTRWPASVRAYVRVHESLLRAIARHSSADVLVDSSKTPQGIVIRSLMRSIELRTAHIVRDPRGVVSSDRRSRSLGNETQPPGRGVLSSAIHWNTMNSLLVAVGSASSVAYEIVPYEHLAARPAEAISGLAEFAGLQPQRSASNGETVVLGDSHVVVGNPNRFEGRTRKIAEDLRWRSELPVGPQIATQVLTAPGRLAVRLGRNGASTSVR
jgi:hypothetical protein